MINNFLEFYSQEDFKLLNKISGDVAGIIPFPVVLGCSGFRVVSKSQEAKLTIINIKMILFIF